MLRALGNHRAHSQTLLSRIALSRETSSYDIASIARGTGFSTASGNQNGGENESHDDFKPQYKGGTPPSISKQIEEDVSSHSVFVYMKGVPQAPMCGFSNMACRILDAYEVEYGSRDVLADPELREGIKKFTHWPTIPQIFINGEFVGGSDILMQMHQKGELQTALEDAKKPNHS